MKLSKLLFKSHKEKSSDETHEKLARGCFILQESAGIFQYTPLGTLVIENLTSLIRFVFSHGDLQEIRLPILQDMKLWVESGRDKIYGPEMFRLKNRDTRDFCLAPTAEESVVFMIKNFISSYKSLPIIVYQMLYKYRDEMRPRYGLIRNKEFLMLDVYSFDIDQSACQLSYAKMYDLYIQLFELLNLDFVFAAAECGEVGGSFSQNVFVRSDNGEDELVLNIPWEEYAIKVKEAKTYEEILSLSRYISDDGQYRYSVVEVGHIFNLSTKYSSSMNAKFTGADGKLHNYEMGCYGIGISRLMQVIYEQGVWPAIISPYNIHLIGINQELSEKFYTTTQYSTLYDDRDCSTGTKFHDADLINIQYRVIIGDSIELQNMKHNKTFKFNSIEELEGFLNENIE